MNQSYGIIENESRVCIFEESRIHFILLVEPVSRFSLTSTLVPTHLLYTKMCRNYKCAACQVNMYVKVATYHKLIIWEQNQFSRLLWLNEMCSTLLDITRPVCWAMMKCSFHVKVITESFLLSAQYWVLSYGLYLGYLVNAWQAYILFVYYFLHKIHFEGQEKSSDYFMYTYNRYILTWVFIMRYQTQYHIGFTI